LTTESFPQIAQAPLAEVVATKPWLRDRSGQFLVDLGLAEAAQEAVRVYLSVAPANSVTPQTLTAVINPDPQEALNSMGLTRVIKLDEPY
jgi:hypothetical protein